MIIASPTAQPLVAETIAIDRRLFTVGLGRERQATPSHPTISPLSPTPQPFEADRNAVDQSVWWQGLGLPASQQVHTPDQRLAAVALRDRSVARDDPATNGRAFAAPDAAIVSAKAMQIESKACFRLYDTPVACANIADLLTILVSMFDTNTASHILRRIVLQ